MDNRENLLNNGRKFRTEMPRGFW